MMFAMTLRSAKRSSKMKVMIVQNWKNSNKSWWTLYCSIKFKPSFEGDAYRTGDICVGRRYMVLSSELSFQWPPDHPYQTLKSKFTFILLKGCWRFHWTTQWSDMRVGVSWMIFLWNLNWIMISFGFLDLNSINIIKKYLRVYLEGINPTYMP